MAVIALKPRREYSFTDHAVANPSVPPPGDRLDGEVDRINAKIGEIIDFLETLRASPAPRTASAPAPVGVLGGQETHSIPGADPNALAMDWAEVSAEWAEHMPDTIPPNILGMMAITGDHWSARWWAHRALEIVQELPGGPGGAAAVHIGAVSPALPTPGLLWWDTVSGQLFVFYNDLSSSQWVPATNQPVPPAVAVPPPPVPANVIAPASGATVTLTDTRLVYVNNPSLLAALTLKLPVATLGTGIEISFKSPITVLTLQDNAGAVIPSAPTSAYGPGAAILMRFEAPGWVHWK